VADYIVNLDSVDVYKTKSKFDYSSWVEESVFTLHRIYWDEDYANVPAWGNAAGLNPVDFFNGVQPADKLVLEGLHRFKPHTHSDTQRVGLITGTLRVEVPFETAVRYNYAVGANPIPPVDGNAPEAKYQWYYFITDYVPISPSVTELLMVVDIWTNFYDEVEILSPFLYQGHALADAVTPSQFLANPLANNRGLLTPEDSVIPEKRSLIYQDHMWESTTLVFASTQYPCGVPGNTDYIPAQSPYVGADAPASTVYWTMSENDFNRFRQWYPAFVHDIKGVFIAPTGMVENPMYAFPPAVHHGPSEWVNYFPLWPKDSVDLSTIQLSVSDFNYPARYAGITKLYTSPYAYLTISNGMNDIRVEIQDLTNEAAVRISGNWAFPFLRTAYEMVGVGGSPAQTFFDLCATDAYHSPYRTVRNLAERLNLPMELPIYQVTSDAYMERSLDQGIYDVAVDNRDKQYQIDVANAQRAYDNAIDRADVNKKKADRTAHTTQENAYVRIANAYTTTMVSAAAAKGIGERDAQATYDIGLASENVRWTNDLDSIAAARAIAYQSALTTYENAERSWNAAKLVAERDADTTKVVTDDAANRTRLNTKEVNLIAPYASKKAADYMKERWLKEYGASWWDAIPDGERPTASPPSGTWAYARYELMKNATLNTVIQANRSAGKQACLQMNQAAFSSLLNYDAAVGDTENKSGPISTGIASVLVGANGTISSNMQLGYGYGAYDKFSQNGAMGFLSDLVIAHNSYASGSAAAGLQLDINKRGTGTIAAPNLGADLTNPGAFSVDIDFGQIQGAAWMPMLNREAFRASRDANIAQATGKWGSVDEPFTAGTIGQSRVQDIFNAQYARWEVKAAYKPVNGDTEAGWVSGSSMGELTYAKAIYDNNAETLYNTATANSAKVKQTAYDDALTQKNLDSANAYATQQADIINMDRQKSTDETNTNRTHYLVVGSDSQTGTLQIAKTTTLADLADAYKASEDNAKSDRSAGWQVADDAMLTALANNTDERQTDGDIADRNLTVDQSNALIKKNFDLASINAEWQRRLLDAPTLIGARRTTELENHDAGLIVALTTMPDTEVIRIGERMIRRGYVCEQPTDFTVETGMRGFAYWKCIDVTVKAPKAPASVAVRLRNQLLEGVTFWADPSKIGDYTRGW